MTKKCKCGHNHISLIGDKNGYNPKYKLIDECENCNCEKFYSLGKEIKKQQGEKQ
jgi:hypothetical protein